MSNYILFYSRKCVYSKKIICILNDYPVLNSLFDKIAIEDVQNFPRTLKEVPAIAINNHQLLQGQEAFNWMEEKVKDSFSSGPEFEKKGNLHYASLDDNMSNINNNTFLINPDPIPPQNVKQSTSKKEQDFNSELERFTKERMEDFPNRGPPPQTPNFSLPS